MSRSVSRVKRVAVLVYHSSPLGEPGSGDAGGMTVYVRAVAREMARRGIASDIFTRATSPLPRVEHVAEGVRVIPIGAGPPRSIAKDEQPRHVPEFVTGVRAFAMSGGLGYDIVHSHYWQSGLAGVELAGVWNIPHVHSHHTLGRVKNAHLAPGDDPEPESRIEGESGVIGSADVLVANTDDEWRQIACYYGAPHDRLKTIYPGVDHDLFGPGSRSDARSHLGLPLDEALVLYVGRIQPLKGIDLGIRAVEQLAPALGPLRFAIVGGPSGSSGEREQVRLRSLATELGVDDLVTFTGPRRHPELRSWYRAADVVVVTSHSESFGLTALEAHASGIPVVGTSVGGLSYIVRDGVSGFLTDSRDPAEFAARLKTILADDAVRDRFGAAAVASAARFSWESTAGALAELYDCLIEEGLPEACTC